MVLAFLLISNYPWIYYYHLMKKHFFTFLKKPFTMNLFLYSIFTVILFKTSKEKINLEF